MDINTMKTIFGSMPIDHLVVAQQLAKKKQKINLIVMGLIAAGCIGVYIGYRIAQNKKANEAASNRHRLNIDNPTIPPKA